MGPAARRTGLRRDSENLNLEQLHRRLPPRRRRDSTALRQDASGKGREERTT